MIAQATILALLMTVLAAFIAAATLLCYADYAMRSYEAPDELSKLRKIFLEDQGQTLFEERRESIRLEVWRQGSMAALVSCLWWLYVLLLAARSEAHDSLQYQLWGMTQLLLLGAGLLCLLYMGGRLVEQCALACQWHNQHLVVAARHRARR